MKFDLRMILDIEKEIAGLKAVRRLSLCVFQKHQLAPGDYSAEVILAASVLQFAPGSSSFNWLNKHTLERILGEYVSESSMLEAAQALGFRVRHRQIQTSKAFINALGALADSGCVIDFPVPEQQKARTA